MFTLPHHNLVLDACREFGIRRLEVFGSSVRSPAAARDVDLLVDFGDSPVHGFSAVFFRVQGKAGAHFRQAGRLDHQ